MLDYLVMGLVLCLTAGLITTWVALKATYKEVERLNELTLLMGENLTTAVEVLREMQGRAFQTEAQVDKNLARIDKNGDRIAALTEMVVKDEGEHE